MIKENQRLLNQLHILSDGIIVFLSMLIAYWIRFYVFNGAISVGLRTTVYYAILSGLLSVFIFAILGIYESFRIARIYKEIGLIFSGMLLVTLVLLAVLFVLHMDNTSRWQLAVFFGVSILLLSAKRLILRNILYKLRKTGFNQKHILIVGSGEMAQLYLDKINLHKTYGFTPIGYIADYDVLDGADYLGKYDILESVLEEYLPDEVVVAIPGEDYERMPEIISICEKSGTKTSLIPYYALYMPSNPQIDNLSGIPLINLRRIPLDNLGNAFLKRIVDLAGSLFLIVLFSPLMLITLIGVKISSPGPAIFKQERVGLNKKTFKMYKFRSMKVNSEENTAWSTDVDDRRT
ncbi:MAG: undecaprenyl-phosphate glucose phosphotransferase, partial [Clostridiales bacterium]|nr:undecaprenyl-phosphate glucose phosphotransferase [Clostridiales bacterium]